MADEQLLHAGGLGQLGGLAGGAVVGLGGALLAFVQKGSLVVEQVGAADEVGQGGHVAGVGAEGVAARGGGGAGHVGVAHQQGRASLIQHVFALRQPGQLRGTQAGGQLLLEQAGAAGLLLK